MHGGLEAVSLESDAQLCRILVLQLSNPIHIYIFIERETHRETYVCVCTEDQFHF